MGNGIEVPFFYNIPCNDAPDALLAELLTKVTTALPRHWIGVGGQPRTIETATERSVVDTDGVCLNDMHEGFGRNFSGVPEYIEDVGRLRVKSQCAT